MAEQSVTLQPGESRIISFEAIPHDAKTYQVSVDGLIGSFTAATPAAALRIDIISVPATCKLWEPCGWEVAVTNVSGPAVSYYLTEYRDNFLSTYWGPFTLSPGETRSQSREFLFASVYDRHVILYASDRKLPGDRRDIPPEAVIYDQVEFTIRGVV